MFILNLFSKIFAVFFSWTWIWIWIRIKILSWIRIQIRIKIMRIHSPVLRFNLHHIKNWNNEFTNSSNAQNQICINLYWYLLLLEDSAAAGSSPPRTSGASVLIEISISDSSSSPAVSSAARKSAKVPGVEVDQNFFFVIQTVEAACLRTKRFQEKNNKGGYSQGCASVTFITGWIRVFSRIRIRV